MTVKKDKSTCDFAGWATVYGVKCSDGRTIEQGAFAHSDGQIIPMVFQHVHNDVSNVLGHGLLESQPKGMRFYGWFNETQNGQDAKTQVLHGDYTSLSIYANALVERSKSVQHGNIREVSLVLSGANPGAKIDYLSITHGDGTETELEDEAIIFSGASLEFSGTLSHEEPEPSDKRTIKSIFDTFSQEEKTATYVMIAAVAGVPDDGEISQNSDSKSESSNTVRKVFESMSEEKKDVVYFMIGEASKEDSNDDSIAQSDLNSNQGELVMSNLFDKTNTEDDVTKGHTLTHDEFAEIVDFSAKNGAKLSDGFLQHAVTYGIENIEYLFPEAKNLTTQPTWIKRETGWVSVIVGGAKHSPFSRIKTMVADITADAARALGYIKGNLKKEEFFTLLRRTTTPTTIYKKQKLDKDDVNDITDFDVVVWMKAEMRIMLDEEIGRAVLIGDGRPVEVLGNANPDKIDETHIRPIYKDDVLYTHRVQLESDVTTTALIEEIIRSRKNYKGTGNPILFTTTDTLTDMLLVKDGVQRRLYNSQAELQSALRVSNIVEVPIMEGVSRDTDDVIPVTLDLVGILVNPTDYTIGADKGGQLSMFEDFDIDYNQMKYLMEVRISGALTLPKSAIVFEKVHAGG